MRLKTTVLSMIVLGLDRCSCETEGGALKGLIATLVPESGEIVRGFCVRLMLHFFYHLVLL